MASPAFSLAQQLVVSTENLLTRHAKIVMRRKLKQSKKNPFIDWIEAFLWAALAVLLINQYLIQAYVIPSESMVPTLNGGLEAQGIANDRIFVDKLSFGPEFLPGFLKLPGINKPQRTDVICFENPTYQSNGTLAMILQRIVYMISFSLVDLEQSNQNSTTSNNYLLIKRIVGYGGEQWRYVDGNFEIKVPGADWQSETSFKKNAGLTYRIERQFGYIDYQNSALRIQHSLKAQLSGQNIPIPRFNDQAFFENKTLEIQSHYLPIFRQDNQLSKLHNGWYVPFDYILPLGDNRDNSNDGRYFGPVSIKKVLGRALFIFFPFNRLSEVR